MSEFRTFETANPLRTATQNGGMSVAEALNAGARVMKDMRNPCLKTIDRVMAEISQKYGPSSPRATAEFSGLYDLAAKIIDVAAPVAELRIDRAAFSLCELVDRCAGQEAWDWPSVDVHLNALQLLRHAGAELKPAERQKILDGLTLIIERLPAAVVASVDDSPEA